MPNEPKAGTQQRFWLAAALVLALVLLAIGLFNWQLRVSQGEERARLLQETERRAEQLVGAVADRIGVLLRSTDFALRQLRRDHSSDDARFRSLAETLQGTFPAQSLRQLTFVDASGALTYARPAQPELRSLREHPHFVAHLAGADQLIVGKPVIEPSSQRWEIPFSRPILHDGRFAGMAMLSLSADYVGQVLATLELAPEDSIALFDGDGAYIARNRDLASVLGKTLPAGRPFLAPDAASRGHFRTPAFADGVERLFAWKRIEPSGLVATVGLAEGPALAQLDARFKREWIQAAAVSALLAVLGAAMLSLLARLARGQSAVAASEARFRSLIQLSSDWYWEQDENYRFTAMHSAVAFRSGITDIALLGQTRWQRPTLNLSEEDWARHRADLDARRPFHDLQLCRLDTSGQPFWSSISGEPVFDDRGRFRGYRGVGVDITQRKAAEEALHKSTEETTALFDTSTAGIMLLRDRAILRCNRRLEECYGYAPGELIGQPTRILFYSEKEWQRIGDEVYVEMRSGKVATSVVAGKHKSGRLIWNLLSGRYLDVNHPELGAVFTQTDITAQKLAEQAHEKLEAQLRQAQKMEALGTLAGGIAHDFNNLLAAIVGNLALARDDAGPAHPALPRLAQIGLAADRARDLVRQILAFSRQQPLDRRVLDLNELAEDVVKMLRATLPTGIELQMSLAPDTPPVLADRNQIHQVLMNLGTNAWQAMAGRRGRIELSLQGVNADHEIPRTGLPAGRYARLSVADDGQGMDAATLQLIFDPFFTTKSVGEGTGLGLAVVAGIVKNHGGAITVDSTPGQGSRFDLYFPAVEAGAARAVELPSPAPVLGKGQRILCVDDEEVLVMIASELLARQGYRPQGHLLAAEALAAFRADPEGFDLLVTDLNMPGISGLEVACECLRLRPGLPVLLVSGNVTEAELAQAHALGIREVIYKPYTTDDLAEAVARALAQG